MGRPCRNTALLVLNEDGTPTPDGEIGELYVRGTSLAMGYHNNPEQTSRAFVQNPLNRSYPEIIYKTGDLVLRERGLYHFKGRADTMVKHMGYRIELADIEHAILGALPAVRNVCVVYASERREIIAYCELIEPLALSAFRAGLGQKLPAYMIPARLVPVDQMPMNANGKIDRLRLKRLAQG
jgi:acyl-coenzyme A synthetase/AMP-(fatty) acid ligase